VGQLFLFTLLLFRATAQRQQLEEQIASSQNEISALKERSKSHFSHK